MALTYPIDVNATAGRWYLYDTDTQADPVKMSGGTGNWPNADGSEIQGLPANLVPLLAVTDDEPVGIDTRLVRLVGEPTIDVPANEIRTSWNIVPRSAEEKKDVVSNIEFEEMAKHFDPNKILIEVCLLLGAILRQNKNLNVPAPLQAFADKFQTRSEKIYKNRLKIDAMLSAIEANQTPILDQQFEPVE